MKQPPVMADAIVFVVVERLARVLEHQIREEIHLVVGAEKEVKNLSKKMKMIQRVLADAEKRSMNDKGVNDWLLELKHLSYDMDDVADEWNTELLKVLVERAHNKSVKKEKISFISCFCLKQVVLRRDIVIRIKELNLRLNEVYEERYQFKLLESDSVDFAVSKPVKSASIISELYGRKTTSIVKESEIYGRVDEKGILLSKLLSDEGSQEEDDHIGVMAIVGTGGLGKTTLAQFVYNDKRVCEEFETRIWICVSDPLDEIRVASAILESVEKRSRDLSELETVLDCIKDAIRGKKLLLVLDDVWNEDERFWGPLTHSLEAGARGSKILVTTRNEKVAMMMGCTYLLRLAQLSYSDCWSLFSQVAFTEQKKKGDIARLENIGREIVKRCNGLPLAAKTLGGVLRFKSSVEEWQNLLNSELWKLEVATDKLFPHLYLSYYDLPAAVRPCFIYCAIYAKDTKIDVADLIKLWMSQGYLASSWTEDLEQTGREYFEILAMRSFFQEFERDEVRQQVISCKMHDIIHDFAQFIARKECLSVENVDKKVKVGSNSCSDHVRHLNWLVHEETASSSLFCNTGNLRTLLTSMLPKDVIPGLLSSLKRVRSLRLLSCGLDEIPEEIHNLIHLRYLNLRGNPLLELPEKLCDLINLETVEVSWTYIRELPQSIGKLINLRHLIISETRFLNVFPQGIESLVNLRTLGKIVVKEGNNLGCLKNLNQLRGTLNIIFKDDLNRDDVRTDIAKARLEDKKYIKELELTFKNVYEVEDDFLDILSSPPNLEVLHICDLPSTRLPSWIASANYLKVIAIYRCQNCTYMPSLGKLPFLENLEINWMGVTHIGREFLGLGNKSTPAVKDYSRNGFLERASSSIFVGFPKLVRLTFYFCNEWKVWEDLTEEDKKNILVFPELQYLGILNCKKLYTLPTRLLRMATSLEVLSISICDTLVETLEERGLTSFSKMSYLDSKDKIGEFLKHITLHEDSEVNEDSVKQPARVAEYVNAQSKGQDFDSPYQHFLGRACNTGFS